MSVTPLLHYSITPLPTDPYRMTAAHFCMFLGSLEDDASVNGLTWFCHRVWPELTRRLPAANFVIGGWDSADRGRVLGQLPGVILAGSIFDVSTHVRDAAIAVFPYRHACKVQDDILHALAMRKAVIATPVVLEGLDLQSGVHLRAVHTTSDWIAVTYHLMMHPEVCAKLGAAGRAYVEHNHSRQLQFPRSAVHTPADQQLPIGLQPRPFQQPKTTRPSTDH